MSLIFKIERSANEILNSLTSLFFMCYARLAAQIDTEGESHSPKMNQSSPAPKQSWYMSRGRSRNSGRGGGVTEKENCIYISFFW